MVDPGGDQPLADHEVPVSVERVVLFSDAVFAIAITLLALEIRLPGEGTLDPARLNEAIADLAPAVFSFALSFWVIGQYWLAHWRRYEFLVRADHSLATINLVHLAFITLVPVTTSLLGTYGNQPMPVVAYAAVVSAAGVFGTASWVYAHRHGLVALDAPATFVRVAALRGLAVPAVFAGALPLLILHPYAVEAAWLLVFPVQLLIGRRLRGARARHGPGPRPGD